MSWTNRDKHELSKQLQVFVSLEHGIISKVYPLIFGVKFFPISRCKKIFFPQASGNCRRAKVADR